MKRLVLDQMPADTEAGFLVEQCLAEPLAELVVGVRYDRQFGYVLTLGSGGKLVELVGDTVTLVLPVTGDELTNALGSLKVSRLLSGYRGQRAANLPVLIESLQSLISSVVTERERISELEINPLFVYPESVVTIDALIQVKQN